VQLKRHLLHFQLSRSSLFLFLKHSLFEQRMQSVSENALTGLCGGISHCVFCGVEAPPANFPSKRWLSCHNYQSRVTGQSLLHSLGVRVVVAQRWEISQQIWFPRWALDERGSL
jgi:hypothetical protein